MSTAFFRQQGDLLFAAQPATNSWDFFNTTTLEIVRRINGITAIPALAEGLAGLYDIPTGDAEKDVRDLLAYMARRGYVTLDDSDVVLEILEDCDLESQSTALVGVSVELTNRCNLNCRYCFAEKNSRRSDLSAEEWISILDGLYTQGLRVLTLTGGEPTIHPGFREILAFAADRFIVQLNTNGTRIDDSLADEVARANLKAVLVSLDSTTPDYHNRYRGPGSWEAAMLAIERLRARGVGIVVSSTISSENLGELDALHELAASMGAEFNPDVVFWAGHARGLPEEFFVAKSVVREYKEKYFSIDTTLGRFGYGCQAAQGFAQLSSRAVLVPCDTAVTVWLNMFPEFATENVRQMVSFEDSLAYRLASFAEEWAEKNGGASASENMVEHKCTSCTVERCWQAIGTLACREYLEARKEVMS